MKNQNNEIVLTDNGKAVLQFMQDQDAENTGMVFVGKDLANDVGIKGIYPVLNSLMKHELIMACVPVARNFTNAKGETKEKDYKAYALTDSGRMFEII